MESKSFLWGNKSSLVTWDQYVRFKNAYTDGNSINFAS
jgi:hypothetical protein